MFGIGKWATDILISGGVYWSERAKSCGGRSIIYAVLSFCPESCGVWGDLRDLFAVRVRSCALGLELVASGVGGEQRRFLRFVSGAAAGLSCNRGLAGPARAVQLMRNF